MYGARNAMFIVRGDDGGEMGLNGFKVYDDVVDL